MIPPGSRPQNRFHNLAKNAVPFSPNCTLSY